MDGATGLPLANGSGIAADFPVAAENDAAFENAEIPTWLGLAPTGGATATTFQTVTFGPVSTVEVATATDPIPRFLAVDPPPDCSMLGDCGSFPTLAVTAPALNLTAQAGGPTLSNWISVNNSGGGLLGWTASVTSERIELGDPGVRCTSPQRSGRLNVQVTPANLTPAIYQATLTIDAGQAGIQNLPLTLAVTPVPSINPAAPQVTAIVHAATWKSGWMVPGSLATVFGVQLGGNNVAVTFDSLAATLLYTGDTQINLMVPAAL